MRYVQPIRDTQKLEEIKHILRQNSYRNWFLFVVGINTGLRISDLLKLRVRDVKKKSHIVINEQKTGKEKRFLINNKLKSIINEYIEKKSEDEYLFASKKTQKPLTRIQAYRILNRAANQVRLEEIGTHTLRKTFGYHFYQQTKDVALLQEIYNHSSPSVTMRYIGINQDIIDSAINNFNL